MFLCVSASAESKNFKKTGALALSLGIAALGFYLKATQSVPVAYKYIFSKNDVICKHLNHAPFRIASTQTTPTMASLAAAPFGGITKRTMLFR